MSAVFTASQRQACFERAQGRCEVCGYRVPEKGWNLHHRKGRGMGGTRKGVSCADGLVVCGLGNTEGCHGYIEGHYRWALDRGYKVPRNGSVECANVPVLTRDGWFLLNHDGTTTPAPVSAEMREIYDPEEVSTAWT